MRKIFFYKNNLRKACLYAQDHHRKCGKHASAKKKVGIDKRKRRYADGERKKEKGREKEVIKIIKIDAFERIDFFITGEFAVHFVKKHIEVEKADANKFQVPCPLQEKCAAGKADKESEYGYMIRFYGCCKKKARDINGGKTLERIVP